MSCCVTSDTLLFPLNLQYNSLPIEKAARVPYPPQSMYLILSIFTLLFYAVDHPCILAAVSIYNSEVSPAPNTPIITASV